MSTKAVSWALHNVRIEPVAKMVLVSMAEPADENGVCWPSQKFLADSSGVHVNTVKRKVKWLQEKGIISVLRRRVGVHKTKNKYRLHIESSYNFLDKTTVQPSSDPDFDSTTEVPSNNDADSTREVPLNGGDSTREVPSKVPERDLQSVEGTTGGTFKGTTGGTRNHHITTTNSNSTATTTGEHPIFNQAEKPSTRDRVTMDTDWNPSDHVFVMLAQRAITEEFAREQLDGFVLFHNGKSDRQGAFDSKFLKHVIHNWESTKTAARPITRDWQPDPQTVYRLNGMSIPNDFIRERLVEFVTYWRESGKPSSGWNAKFMESVMTSWNKKVGSAALQTPGGQAVSQHETDTNAEQLVGRLTDRSWAEG